MTRSPAAAEVTQLLIAWGKGDSSALDRLVPEIEDELHRLARFYMAREPRHHTLQATALVNEAWLRLIDCENVCWNSRAQFFALAAKLMRRILVDSARARGSQKRGGALKAETFDDAAAGRVGNRPDLVALDDALRALEQMDERKARVVELRYFGGLSNEEIADLLQVSSDTISRDWRFAKVWLLKELRARPE